MVNPHEQVGKDLTFYTGTRFFRFTPTKQCHFFTRHTLVYITGHDIILYSLHTCAYVFRAINSFKTNDPNSVLSLVRSPTRDRKRLIVPPAIKTIWMGFLAPTSVTWGSGPTIQWRIARFKLKTHLITIESVSIVRYIRWRFEFLMRFPHGLEYGKKVIFLFLFWRHAVVVVRVTNSANVIVVIDTGCSKPGWRTQ